MIPKLETSLVVAKDLKDQPDSLYILLTGAGRPVYYAVDTWSEYNGTMSFYRAGVIVYVCRTEGHWAVVKRTETTIMTEADVVMFQHTDSKAQEEFYAALDPEGWKEAQKLVKHGALAEMMGGGHGHSPSNGEDKPTPGQYL